MSKKIIYSAIFLCLLFTASFVLADVQITPIGPTSFTTLFEGISTTILGVVGAIATIMIIVAGIFYLTSAGSPEKMKLAKTTLIYAIAGIVVALAADAIIGAITGAIGG